MSEDNNAADPSAPTVAEMFYGGESVTSEYEPALADSVNQLGDRAGWTEAERTAHTLEWSHFYTDAGLRGGAASVLHSLLAQHTAAPVDDATVLQWAAESRRALREMYGSQAEAERRLAIASQFIAARPEIAQRLTESGIGSHPRLVMALAEQAGLTPRLRMTPRKRT